MAYKNLELEKTKQLCQKVFASYGFLPEDCDRITDILLTADLFGIESHGIQRLIRYYNELSWNLVDANAKLEIVKETPVSAMIDAHGMMGQVAAYHGMEMAIEKAKKSGVGLVVMRGSNHYGIAGYYSKMACDADLIGLCMTNTSAIMVPTFGKRPMLGTNPIALAMPADPTPFLYDAATTVVARGKFEVYDKKGLPVPLGWSIDEEGVDCTDPGLVIKNLNEENNGGIMPLGGSGEEHAGYKGYGLGMIVEIFTSILSMGETSDRIVTKGDNHSHISHCFGAIDYGMFGDKAAIKSYFSDYLNKVRQSPKAKGHDRIYIHGEKELETCATRTQTGIPVNEKTFEEIKFVCRERGIDYRPYIGEDF